MPLEFSVHAKTSSSFAAAIRGNCVPNPKAMSAGRPRVPLAPTVRTLSCDGPLANSIHDTAAEPSASSSTWTRPVDPASSTRMGARKVRPASDENET